MKHQFMFGKDDSVLTTCGICILLHEIRRTMGLILSRVTHTLFQISVVYMIALLLFYNIMSLRTDNNPSENLVKSSFWAPILIFILPYVILLPPAVVSN